MAYIDEYVNGKTEVFGVIGDPICHTYSPIIQNTIAHGLNKNIVYMPFHVNNENLKNAVYGAHALGIKGINVTVPHKKTIMEFLTSIDSKAEQIGAVNTLKYTDNGYCGYNTDILGLLYSFKSRNIDINEKTVLILGAGGSACAAVVMSASEGAKKIIIANRTIENAEKLKYKILNYYDITIETINIDDIYTIKNCDIIIQTTTLGFGKNIGMTPIKDNCFFNEKGVKVVFDAIYTPWETTFLKAAKKSGCLCINGFDMLFYQAAAAQEIWFNESFNNEFKENYKNEIAQYFKSVNLYK